MSTDRVQDAEDLATTVEDPGLCVSLSNQSNDHELYESKETSIGSDRETSRVLLQHWGLQNQPAGPGEAVTNEVDATQRPALAFGIPKRRK